MNTEESFALGAPAPSTVLIPNPGGAAHEPRGAPLGGGAVEIGPALGVHALGAGLNPLIEAASPLLTFLVRLRSSAASPPDPVLLRDQAAELVRQFETRARGAELESDTVFSARYVLCTALDELVLTTPWGAQSVWATRNLLSTFHHEVSGGETFFRLLSTLSLEPARNLDMLELMYVVLSLGFEGGYRVMPNGRNALEQTREHLSRIIRNQRGDYERTLSIQWQPSSERRHGLTRYVPLWVILAVALVLLTGAYALFSFALNRASEPVLASLNGLARQTMPVVRAPAPDLAGFLSVEVAAKLVTLKESPGQTAIVIQGDGLFRSASAKPRAQYDDLLIRIAAALNEVRGRVVVTGHSDNIPIRTLKYPSNWDLSAARAENVRHKLAAELDDPSRLSAEGRADTEPVAANDTKANRSLNRRVEIVLHSSPLR